MSAYVTVETAKVYRSPGGRRYFSPQSAYLRAARERIAQNYPCACEPSEVDASGVETWPGALCERHDPDHTARFERLQKRLARLMARADRKAPR